MGAAAFSEAVEACCFYGRPQRSGKSARCYRCQDPIVHARHTAVVFGGAIHFCSEGCWRRWLADL